jgi:putative transposase
MKGSKFTDAQKAFVIKQGEEETPVGEICRKAGISQATYLDWKKKYAALMPSGMGRLRELEDENGDMKTNFDPPAVTSAVCKRRIRIKAQVGDLILGLNEKPFAQNPPPLLGWHRFGIAPDGSVLRTRASRQNDQTSQPHLMISTVWKTARGSKAAIRLTMMAMLNGVFGKRMR